MDHLCIDCRRPIGDLKIKGLKKSDIERCAQCYKRYHYGQCLFVHKGVRCPFRPNCDEEFCERHYIFQESQKFSFKRRHNSRDGFFTNEQWTHSNASSSRSEKPRKSRERTKNKMPDITTGSRESQYLRVFGLKDLISITCLSPRDFNSLYLKRALILHPDKNTGVNTTAEFQVLQAAKEHFSGMLKTV
jgi:hypothetical protein